MATNIERNTNVIYQLFSNPYGLKTVQEPVGYNNDTRGYERDKDSRGFIVKTDIDLEFYGSGADYLTTLFDVYGISEKCTLTKYERDDYSLSESFKIRYIQEIDLGTFKRNHRTGKVTVNATEGGLFEDIKNRESDEYDLINNLSADEDDIGEIKTVDFNPVPRSLFLESYLKKDYYDYRVNTVVRTALGAVTRGIKTIPLKIEYESGDGVQTPYNVDVSNNPNPDSESIDLGSVEDTGNIFYWRSDIERTLNVKLKLDFVVKNTTYQTFNLQNQNLKVVIRTSEIDPNNNLNDILVRKIPILDINYTEQYGIKQSIDESYNIPLKEGQSASICFEVSADTLTGDRAVIQMYMDVSKSELVVEDNTDYAPTSSRAMKPIDFFDRIIAKITGKNGLVKSDLFTIGKYKDILIDNGLWARQFPDSYLNPNEEEQNIQMKSSFKDAFESFNYLEPLCWFTYFEGNTEMIRIEEATYTQQNFIGLDLGSVDDIKSEASKIDFFSNINIGHTQSMEYEELSGLDEPNGKSEFNTFITRSMSKYEALTKIRTDPTGYELIRRKPYNKFPKEDTSRDSNLFMHDAKLLLNGQYTHNIYTDLLDELPKGVFRPDNLWNFRLSPMNRLYYGHGYSVKRGLFHFPNKLIRFNSSNSNQNLITKMGGVELKENGSIKIKDLEKPKIEAEKITFSFKMTQLIEDSILDFSNINGELIPNYFGLIRYKEKGEDKYGRLVKLETTDEAKMTIIKARL